MEMPDPDPSFTSNEDLDKRIEEVLREVAAMRADIEENRWWRWLVAIGISMILWRVW